MNITRANTRSISSPFISLFMKLFANSRIIYFLVLHRRSRIYWMKSVELPAFSSRETLDLWTVTLYTHVVFQCSSHRCSWIYLRTIILFASVLLRRRSRIYWMREWIAEFNSRTTSDCINSLRFHTRSMSSLFISLFMNLLNDESAIMNVLLYAAVEIVIILEPIHQFAKKNELHCYEIGGALYFTTSSAMRSSANLVHQCTAPCRARSSGPGPFTSCPLSHSYVLRNYFFFANPLHTVDDLIRN